MPRIHHTALGERTTAVPAPGGDRLLGRSCRARRNPVSRPRRRLPGDPGRHQAGRAADQPYLGQFRPHRVSGDWNVVFPLDRLRELAAEGAIGKVAPIHYSFMGATDPVQMEPYARALAELLKQDSVDAVLLPPV